MSEQQSQAASRAMSAMSNQIKTNLENTTKLAESSAANHKVLVDMLTNIMTTLVSLENRIANLETKSTAPKRTVNRAPKSDATSNTPPTVRPTKHTTAIPWFVEQYTSDPEFILKYVSKEVFEKHLAAYHSKPQYTTTLAKLNGLDPKKKVYTDEELSKAKLTREEASKFRQNLEVTEVQYIYSETIKRDSELNLRVNKDHKAYLDESA